MHNSVLIEKDRSGSFTSLAASMESILSALKKHLKIRDADFLIRIDNENFSSFSQQSYPQVVRDICNLSINEKKSYYIHPNKPQQNDNGFANLDLSVLQCALASIPFSIQVEQATVFAVLYVSNPLYPQYFTRRQLQWLEPFVSQIKKVLFSIWEHKGSQSMFVPVESALIQLQKNIYHNTKLNAIEERLSSMMHIFNLIHAHSDIDQLIKDVIESARGVLHTENASLFMLDKDTGELYFDFLTGEDAKELMGKRIPSGQGIVGLCAQKKEALIVNNADKDLRMYRDAGMDKVQTRNLIAAPLLINGECIGVIEAINTIDRSHFTHSDLVIFKSFSSSVAIALQRRMLLDSLEKANDALEKKLKQTIVLHSISNALVKSTSSDTLFANVVSILQEHLNIAKLSLFIYDKEKDELIPRVVRGTPIEQIWESIPVKLAKHVYTTQKSIMVKDINDDPQLQELLIKKRYYQYNTCMLLVLEEPQSKIPYGLLCVSNPKAKEFTEDDYLLLSTVASEISRGYHSFLMQEKIIAQKAITQELEITARVQKDILPQEFSKHNYVDIKTYATTASNTVGGDLYYYHTNDPNKPVTMLIGDVSGKFISAALFMAVTSSAVKTIIQSETSPNKILAKANYLLCQESKRGMFVTMFLAHYNPRNNILEYASAGHNEMLLLRKNGSCEVLCSKGKPLGVIEGASQEYNNKQIHVAAGDTLVLYTDGVTEAINHKQEEFGLGHLMQILQDNSNLEIEELTKLVNKSVISFCNGQVAYDDLTLMMCRFKKPMKAIQQYHFCMPATNASIVALLHKIEQILLDNQITQNLKSDIILVMEEAMTNIVNHAYKDTEHENPEFKCELNLELETDNKLRIVLQDQGKAFDFDSVKRPEMATVLSGKVIGGFGIALMKAIVDKIDYYHKEGINTLIMEKKVSC